MEPKEPTEKVPANDQYAWDICRDVNRFGQRNPFGQQPVYSLRCQALNNAYLADITRADTSKPFEEGENAVLHLMDFETGQRQNAGTYRMEEAMSYAQDHAAHFVSTVCYYVNKDIEARRQGQDSLEHHHDHER